jgi:hypothetical protein
VDDQANASPMLDEGVTDQEIARHMGSSSKPFARRYLAVPET